ncbi:MAG: preprotein translocase subunit SecG [Rhodospirillaceae bacterium]
MVTVVLAIHILIAVAMVALILLQRSEGGALGIGGSGGGGGGLMTGRAAGNVLTRSTGFLAAAFMTTSLILAIMANQRAEEAGLLDRVAPDAAQNQENLPDQAPGFTIPAAERAGSDGAGGTPDAPSAPATPAIPSAPVAE